METYPDDPLDVEIEIYDVSHGFAARLRNEGTHPVKNCRLVFGAS